MSAANAAKGSNIPRSHTISKLEGLQRENTKNVLRNLNLSPDSGIDENAEPQPIYLKS